MTSLLNHDLMASIDIDALGGRFLREAAAVEVVPGIAVEGHFARAQADLADAVDLTILADQAHGDDIIDFVKQTFITKNRTGCCFVTVDALRSAVPFYESNGFKPLRKVNEGETIPMYYDLTQLI